MARPLENNFLRLDDNSLQEILRPILARRGNRHSDPVQIDCEECNLREECLDAFMVDAEYRAHDMEDRVKKGYCSGPVLRRKRKLISEEMRRFRAPLYQPMTELSEFEDGARAMEPMYIFWGWSKSDLKSWGNRLFLGTGLPIHINSSLQQPESSSSFGLLQSVSPS